VDYEGDGDLDILSGSYTGELYLFERLDSGQFAQGRFLTVSDGTPLKCSTSITPEAIDIDADGDLDLVIGSRSSGVFIITNVGTRNAPVWSKESSALKTVSGKRVKGSNAHHADWDGDGVRDLVLGSEYGEVVWHRNVGTSTEPRYGERQTLIDQGDFTRIEEGAIPTRPGSRTKVHVTDYNGDGRVDLLVGDVQWHSYRLPPLTPEQEQEKADLLPRYEAAQKAFWKLVEERNSYVGQEGGIPQEVLDRLSKADEEFSPFRKKMYSFERDRSKTHGYVWLYLRGEKSTRSKKVESRESTSGPVSFQIFATPVNERPGHYLLTAHLNISKGWHVYAQPPVEGQYAATILEGHWPEGMEARTGWKSKSAERPDPQKPAVFWYVGETVFECEVYCAEDKDYEFSVEVGYQVCNDQICLPASSLIVELRL